MSPFVPPQPPLVPDAPEPPPTLDTPLAPPLVGEGSPWAPIDGENRDRVLDWWRMWFRRVFFPWIGAWVLYWKNQWIRLIAYINEWLAYAGEYIEDHAVNGHSWYKTDDAITPETTSLVEIEPYDEFRPLLVGDLVSDTTRDVNYGRIVSLVDDTHANVLWIGSLLGLPGYGWWATTTPIALTGTTDVVLAPVAGREPQINDLVVDNSETSTYGRIVSITSATAVTVEYIGKLQGPPGIAALGSATFTTPALAPRGDEGDVFQAEIELPQMVGAFVLTTDAPSWVRVYASEAYMIADADRSPDTPINIADDHGCYLDFVSIPSELSKTLTPGIMFTDIGLGLWVSVANLDLNDPATITVHIDYRTFRE